MVRLKHIAAQAGVSIMTVSKALRDAHDVSAKTKARIRQLADQMGYVPDALARGLRTRTTKLIGLVIPAVDHPISARIIAAIEEKSFELGYELVCAQSLSQVEREEALLRRMLARRVDGLLIAPVYRFGPSATIYDEVARRGTPTIIIGPGAPFCRQFPSVHTEDRLGGERATKHLIELGHRRIAFFGGPAAAPWAQERMEGYRRALREAKIEMDDRLIFTAGSTIEEGQKAALQMLNEAPHATAIQAVNDQIAIGAAGILLDQGVKIPQEMSIVGFGNILLSQHFRVPLTTVSEPKRRLGAAAMEALIGLLQGKSAASVQLPAHLILRASTLALS
ncbi:MAG: LacI family DNA-binding transcriptional regulator [Verrucomicrobia bacterium]|nr:LacI family DNA-binding transcriptional regulator [Verrucomicrobiota bacterium]